MMLKNLGVLFLMIINNIIIILADFELLVKLMGIMTA